MLVIRLDPFRSYAVALFHETRDGLEGARLIGSIQVQNDVVTRQQVGDDVAGARRDLGRVAHVRSIEQQAGCSMVNGWRGPCGQLDTSLPNAFGLQGRRIDTPWHGEEDTKRFASVSSGPPHRAPGG